MSPTSPAQAKPTNATKNPFTSAMPKRSHEMSENYIFGDVKHPKKRARTGIPTIVLLYVIADPKLFTIEREPGGKPPSGYSCRRCGSADVGAGSNLY